MEEDDDHNNNDEDDDDGPADRSKVQLVFVDRNCLNVCHCG
jgi:hypothetical protein